MSALDHFRLLRADARTEIHDLTLDSRAAGEGSLFLALHGAREDGADYAKEAAARGAVCVVTEHAAEGVPCVLVPDAHEAAAKLAARWYGEPAGRMTVVGVTGTNGKTTTTYLLKQLLERCLGAKVGLIGTNQNMIGDAVLPAERTTPDALTLQRLLREMADAGCTHVVMEVSSHALVQRRAGAIDFALGVFTNLTQDHLDYHGTMEAYCDAKARLFRQCRAAAVNGDDPWTPRLLENVTCPVTRFGQGLANDLVGWDAHYCADRVSFTACSDSEHIPVTLHIPGAFSLYNALAALAAAQALGIPIEDAAQALSLCQGVRGRAEVVPTDTDYTVLIDYAHTPDGLKNILSTVCGFADARVWVPESIFHGKHAIDNIAMLHALENNDLLIPCSIFMVITLGGVYLIFRALKKKNSGNIVSYTLATIVGLFLMLDSSLQPPVLNTKADKHLAPVIEKKFDTSKLYSYMSVDMLHFFSLNFYLGDKIQQFDKVLPQDGVLMIPEEDMPAFKEKFGKDYTFQKVWEVKRLVECRHPVGFYQFVKVRKAL